MSAVTQQGCYIEPRRTPGTYLYHRLYLLQYNLTNLAVITIVMCRNIAIYIALRHMEINLKNAGCLQPAIVFN